MQSETSRYEEMKVWLCDSCRLVQEIVVVYSMSSHWRFWNCLMLVASLIFSILQEVLAYSNNYQLNTAFNKKLYYNFLRIIKSRLKWYLVMHLLLPWAWTSCSDWYCCPGSLYLYPPACPWSWWESISSAFNVLKESCFWNSIDFRYFECYSNSFLKRAK